MKNEEPLKQDVIRLSLIKREKRKKLQDRKG